MKKIENKWCHVESLVSNGTLSVTGLSFFFEIQSCWKAISYRNTCKNLFLWYFLLVPPLFFAVFIEMEKRSLLLMMLIDFIATRHFRFICLVRWWLKWWHIDSANWIMDNDDVVSGDVVRDYNDLDDDDDEPLDTPWFIHE